MDIQYYPSLRCNFKCDYCKSQSNQSFSLEENKKTIFNVFKLLKIKNHKINSFYIIGGEPSFYKNIYDILRYIFLLKKTLKNDVSVELQTNLSMPMNIYANIIQYIDYFSISFHYNELKRHHLLDRFLKNTDYIIKNNKIYNFDIMLENTDDVDKFHQYIKDNVLGFSDKSKFSEMIYAYYGYDKNDISSIKNKDFYKKYSKTKNTYFINSKKYETNELFDKKLDFRGMYCETGMNSLNIFGNGDVYLCAGHANNFFTKNSKPFCNINSDFSKCIINKSIKCVFDECCGDFYLERKNSEFIKEPFE